MTRLLIHSTRINAVLMCLQPDQSSITTSTAPNISLDRTIAFPPFVLLSSNPSSGCDLFGPLCQTGSIVAEVEHTGTTITTTVPCSDYLRAQSAFLQS